MTARERSLWLEQLAIQEVALDLTSEKGYGGFTMDELAERVGMPRRTLFQRVGDKMSAVLGVVEDSPIPEMTLPADRSYSPFDGYLAMALRLVDDTQVDESVVAIHAKMRKVLVREPRLAQESARRTIQSLEMAAELLRREHGWAPDDTRPRVLARVMGALVEEAITRTLAAREKGETLDFGRELQSLAEALKDTL